MIGLRVRGGMRMMGRMGGMCWLIRKVYLLFRAILPILPIPALARRHFVPTLSWTASDAWGQSPREGERLRIIATQFAPANRVRDSARKNAFFVLLCQLTMHNCTSVSRITPRNAPTISITRFTEFFFNGDSDILLRARINVCCTHTPRMRVTELSPLFRSSPDYS